MCCLSIFCPFNAFLREIKGSLFQILLELSLVISYEGVFLNPYILKKLEYLIQSTNVWVCSDETLKFSDALLQFESKSICRLIQQFRELAVPEVQ